MRNFHSIVPVSRPILAAAFAAFLALPAAAQDDDLYGVPETPGAARPAASESADTALAADTASAPATAPADTVAAPAASAPDTVRAAPRPRVTRETTVNPLDTRRGNYRNPKKALFMSLMVPGLGQAYVGQTAFNYSRAVLYFGTEVALIGLWYHYTEVKYDRQVKRYRRFADEHWSQGAYEEAAFLGSDKLTFADLNPFRASYCEAVVERGTGGGEALYRGCMNLLTPDSATGTAYQNFRSTYDEGQRFGANPPVDSVSRFRAGFADPVDFYSLIGRYQEFVGGWDDVTGLAYGDSSISGASENRTTYAAMRKKAQDYSRMQAWFIGGIVLNHIASAVDAAITARRNNRRLYEGEARWYDKVGVDGGLAFEAGQPVTRMTARLSF